jgi:F-box/TPR repeat protein Pof3
VIDLTPDWRQGYVRSARLWFLVQQFDTAAKMVDLALERVSGNYTKTRMGVALPTETVSSWEETAHWDASLAAYHARRLPIEIFGEIFAIATDVDVTRAILVSHVCSRWRSVALNTPSLWRYLVLTSKNPAEKTEEWKKQSGGDIRELCVRIKLFEGDMDLTTVLQNIPWDRLRICRLERVPIDLITNILNSLSMRHVLSSLIGLELNSLGLDDLRTLTVGDVALSQIQTLTIHSLMFSWNMISTRDLVSLCVTRSSVLSGSLLNVLKANPMLEELILNTGEPPDTSPISPFALSRLIHLAVIDTLVLSLCDIGMPSLRILRLATNIGGTDVFLQSLLDQGRIALTRFSFQGNYITASNLISFLEAASLLETFRLTNMDDANTVIEALANDSPLQEGSTITVNSPASYANPICPSLKHVVLSSCQDLTTEPIVRFVESRLPRNVPDPQLNLNSATADECRVAQIKALVVDRCPRIDLKILPWLQSKVRFVSYEY